MTKLKQVLLPAIDPESAADAWPVVRAGLLVILIFFVLGGAWLIFAPLAGAVIAPGAVKVDLNRKTVQHQEGGIVKEVRVRDGDRVAAGQVLIVLDDVRVDASLELLRAQFDSERARHARLTAERLLAAKIDFPAELVERSRREPKVAEILQREEALARARRATLDEQRRLLAEQRRQTDDEATALTRQIAAEARALKLQQDELAANRELEGKGFVGSVRVKTVARAVEEYESRHGEHQADLARAQQKGTDLALRGKTLENQFMQAAADELKDSTNKLIDLEERLRPTRDAAERQQIRAPIAGVVVDLRVTSAGAVIGPRDPLLDVVPTDAKLIVEGRIRTEDINFVHGGGAAEVRLIAFKARTTPTVDATVSYVAADSLVDRATGMPYYTVQVDVSPQSLREAGDLKLQAGMPAEIYIKTAERTALQYVLEPVSAYLARAFREP